MSREITKLDSVWLEIQSRAEGRERLDLAYIEPIPDEVILEALRAGRPYPGKDRYADWLRRREARERRASGMPTPPMRTLWNQYMGATPLPQVAPVGREPGEEG